ncbi:MAG: relaxase/mobilization nuclease domain-containing protein, partial [Xanthobacteraceae bacterium]|nr:relaxase/mobilization nuclease domain-containing protein [Xanthobacteraceae bacterium]
MIIRIGVSGGSFLAAGKYYLHDKLDEERAEAARSGERVGLLGQSDERVWFTDTRNTLNSDPERALEEMWRTAEDQAYLKMQAGVKRGGRVCEDPVKTISLSWHKDDTPAPDHMVQSANAFLKHMGWDNHQAVYVGHSDTEHRHIHIILNRIDHETGRTLDDFRERKRAQVWALAYEKDHDNVRCEERELRAAKREQRAPELNDGKVPAAEADRDTPTPQPVRTPANDHLPHNVVMLSRPLEQEFAADERQRAAIDEKERAELKAHQRAEREAFFKDGAKLFKATRHAAYDEVRKEFKAEWREFYKDARQSGFAGAFAKDSAIKDAIELAAAGHWQEARERFGGRDDVKLELAQQLADRKASIEERQKAEIAERQRDACDALRDVRDVQYQELLHRQRDERAAYKAGAALEAAGGVSHSPADQISRQPAEHIANENSRAGLQQHALPISPSSAIRDEHGQAADQQQPNASPLIDTQALAQAVRADAGNALDLSAIDVPGNEGPAPARGVSDLAAGAIGGVASYAADQLGELFAP